jgi:hypothetical protein
MTEPMPGPWAAASGNWAIGLLEPLTEINERAPEAGARFGRLPRAAARKGGRGLAVHSR